MEEPESFEMKQTQETENIDSERPEKGISEIVSVGSSVWVEDENADFESAFSNVEEDLEEEPEKKERFSPVVYMKNAADDVSDSVRDVAEGLATRIAGMRVSAAEKKKEKLRRNLSPITLEELGSEDFANERLIRIVDRDVRLGLEDADIHAGFYEITKSKIVPTIYARYAKQCGFTFYPTFSESVYLADPCIPGKFILIDEYYEYMKKVRVNELLTVAQSVGAQSARIVMREEQKSAARFHLDFSLPNTEGKAAGRKKADSFSEIWAEVDFDHPPCEKNHKKPKLVYFSGESDILSLVQMAESKSNRLKRMRYVLKSGSSSGLSFAEAGKITETLIFLDSDVGGEEFKLRSVREKDSVLEYTIQF